MMQIQMTQFVQGQVENMRSLLQSANCGVHKASEITKLLFQDYILPIASLSHDTTLTVVSQVIKIPGIFRETAKSVALRKFPDASLEISETIELLRLPLSKSIKLLERGLLQSFQSFQFVRSTLFSPFYLFIAHINEPIRGLVIMSPRPARFFALLSGVTTHLILFNRGEWDRAALTIEIMFLAFEAVVFSLFFDFKEWSVLLFLKMSGIYISGILLSTLVYRLLFHPLYHFPGPFLARICALWRRPSFQSVWDDHRRYGDFVRVGPRELSINNVEAFHQIHGSKSPCLKGPIYECTLERTLQDTLEDPKLTEQVRVWEESLDHKQYLKLYEPIIRQHCEAFVDCLRQKADSPINMTELCRYFSYDVMSDLIFGKSFGLVQSRKAHPVILQADFTQNFLGSFKSTPWLITLLKSSPFESWSRKAWRNECITLFDRRNMAKNKNPYERDDFYSALRSYAQSKNHKEPFNDSLIRDADLAMATGTDTVAYTLSALMFLLSQYPDKQALLQEEIEHVPPNGPGFTFDYLKFGASYLNACINETMRLYPVIPGGIQRLTPPEGVIIAGRFIPGNMIVSTPLWSMHRDPRYFVSPDAFIPERWTTQQDLILEWDAYVPFLTGPYRCPARQFATFEIRMLVSWIFYEFQLQSPETDRMDTRNIIQNPGAEEKFILQFPEYQVVFCPRERSFRENDFCEVENKSHARSTRRHNELMKRLERVNRMYSKSAVASRRSSGVGVYTEGVIYSA